jgi:hypothetical protein
MLTVTGAVAGADAAESWQRVLHGLWKSGLRLATDAFVMDFDEGAIITDWDSRIGKINYLWREGKITAAAE